MPVSMTKLYCKSRLKHTYVCMLALHKLWTVEQLDAGVCATTLLCQLMRFGGACLAGSRHCQDAQNLMVGLGYSRTGLRSSGSCTVC